MNVLEPKDSLSPTPDISVAILPTIVNSIWRFLRSPQALTLSSSPSVYSVATGEVCAPPEVFIPLQLWLS